MAVRQIVLDTTKAYATEANAIKAVESKLDKVTQDLRYIIVCNANGRFYPLFLGEKAVQCGVHFHGFHIVG